MQRDSKILPRGTVTYSIWVWSTVKSRQITADVTANGQATFKPGFALCPTANGTTCHVGSLPAYQALELLVTDYIGRKAQPGEQIGLTVVVQGASQDSPGGPLSPAEATVSTVLGQPSSPTPPPGTGVGTFPTTAPGLPGTTISPGPISSLFPTISPSPSPANNNNTARLSKRKVIRATSTASSLPFDSRLIGGQLAGLAVLAAAITMVVARLSLRTPQIIGQAGKSAAAAPPPPEPADTSTAASTQVDTTATKVDPESSPEA